LAAEGDIIVITMNFRLNYHGFLSSGDHRVKGKDEERIIKWNLIRINEDFLIKTDE
jgi:carboxylesterase type B